MASGHIQNHDRTTQQRVHNLLIVAKNVKFGERTNMVSLTLSPTYIEFSNCLTMILFRKSQSFQLGITLLLYEGRCARRLGCEIRFFFKACALLVCVCERDIFFPNDRRSRSYNREKYAERERRKFC